MCGLALCEGRGCEDRDCTRRRTQKGATLGAAKTRLGTEGRAGRVIPGHWRAGVHYAFADDGDRYRNVDGYGGDLAEGQASEGLSFRVLEEVVVRRGDGTTRVARIEAMHEDEVVVVLGPSAGKDQGEELPFRVLDRKMVGKILPDDWVESDVASPSSSGRSRYYTACDARVLV